MSRWRIRIRSVPKRGEPTQHNKDRAAAINPRRGRLRLAVADGASQAYGADVWAQQLVDAWTERRLDVGQSNFQVSATIGRLSAEWGANAEPTPDSPWYVAAKASRGSFSTLLGIDVRLHGGVWRWRALAVGDTDLFVLDRSGAMTLAYPVSRSRDFGSAPELVSTGQRNPDLERGRRIRRSGLLPIGGRLMVTTDALAKCLLTAHEDKWPLWDDALAAGRSTSEFTHWIHGLRSEGRLEDDDTTLVVAERTP